MIEEHLTSKKLSKRLKDLGVPQESEFYWIYTDAPLKDGSRWAIVAGKTLGDSHWELGGEQDTYSAFLSSELGELLPFQLYIEEEYLGGLEIIKTFVSKEGDIYTVSYQPGCNACYEQIIPSQSCTSMPNAMGLMLEYLIVNGLIKL